MAPKPNFKKASIWSLGGTGAAQVLRFANNLILWQLLFPEAFGVMAIVNGLLLGLALVSDVGIAASIVQNPRAEEPEFLRTAWTVQVLRGLALGAVVFLLAEPVAAFYQVPELADFIRVCALCSIIKGLSSTRLKLRTRNVQMRPQVLIGLGSQIVGMVVSIIWALVSPSVWALVVGTIANLAFSSIASHFALSGQYADRFGWDRKSALSLFSFGKWVFISTLFTFAAMHADRLLFGKLITLTELGAYSVGQGFAAIPSQILSQLSSTVIFPLLSRLQADRGVFVATFGRTRMPIMLLSGWMCSALFAAGPATISILYGERAQIASWTVAVLAPGIWAMAMRSGYESGMLAIGKPRWTATANAAKVFGMSLLIPAGYLAFGFPGAVAGYAASEYAAYVAGAIAAGRNGFLLLRQDAAFTAIFVLVCVVSGPIHAEIQRLGWPLIADAAINAAFASLVWGGMWVLHKSGRLGRALAPQPQHGLP